MSGKLIGWIIVIGIVCAVVFVPAVRNEAMGLFNKAKTAHQERGNAAEADREAEETARKANAERRDGTGAKVYYEHESSVYHTSTDCEEWKGRKRAGRTLAEAQQSSLEPCSVCKPPTK
jgi:hypothetical protein